MGQRIKPMASQIPVGRSNQLSYERLVEVTFFINTLWASTSVTEVESHRKLRIKGWIRLTSNSLIKCHRNFKMHKKLLLCALSSESPVSFLIVEKLRTPFELRNSQKKLLLVFNWSRHKNNCELNLRCLDFGVFYFPMPVVI